MLQLCASLAKRGHTQKRRPLEKKSKASQPITEAPGGPPPPPSFITNNINSLRSSWGCIYLLALLRNNSKLHKMQERGIKKMLRWWISHDKTKRSSLQTALTSANIGTYKSNNPNHLFLWVALIFLREILITWLSCKNNKHQPPWFVVLCYPASQFSWQTKKKERKKERKKESMLTGPLKSASFAPIKRLKSFE